MIDKRHKTIVFLFITFLWSWISWIIALSYIPNGIDEKTFSIFIKLFFIGTYGPSISAIITTLFFEGINRTITLFKKLFIWKFSVINYLYVVFLPIIFTAVGIGIYSLFGGQIGNFDKNGLFVIPAMLWAGLFAGPLGEELGWRGFLLPEFQKKFNPIISATLIGVIWFSWHIPLFWAPFGALISGMPFAILPFMTYLLMVISLSWIITWLVNSSRNSVLIAVLFHLSINAGVLLMFFPELQADYKKVHLFSGIPMILFAIYLGLKTKLVTKRVTE